MEDLLLGQVRGILILAQAAKLRKDTRAYFTYLTRANALLKLVASNRGLYEQRAA